MLTIGIKVGITELLLVRSNAQVKVAILKKLKKKKKKKKKISSASTNLCKHLSRDTMFTLSKYLENLDYLLCTHKSPFIDLHQFSREKWISLSPQIQIVFYIWYSLLGLNHA
jgi:hypothetical protein